MAFYVSGQLLTEDYYVFNKLAKGLIRTNQYRHQFAPVHVQCGRRLQTAVGRGWPPHLYEDLEQAKTVLFAGSNMACASGVVPSFGRSARTRCGHPLDRVDPRRTDTAAMADLQSGDPAGHRRGPFKRMLHHLIWKT